MIFSKIYFKKQPLSNILLTTSTGDDNLPNLISPLISSQMILPAEFAHHLLSINEI
jgi:hypothetical protein